MKAIRGLRRRLGRELGKAQLALLVRRYCHGKQRRADSQPRLGIGPAIFASGPARAWAVAVATYEDRCDTESFGPRRGTVLDFDYDRTFTVGQWFSRPWQIAENVPYVLTQYTHLLLTSGRSVFGQLRGKYFDSDLPYLGECGISVGVVLHGSDVRDPDHHAATEPLSPYRGGAESADPSWSVRVDTLRRESARLRERLDANPSIPKFVSTPGLLDYVSDAEWLPVVVAAAKRQHVHRQSDGPPIILHIPTNPTMKGTRFIDPICRKLEQAGLIRYTSPGLLTPGDFSSLLEQASIVIDAVSQADGPTVTACQAMAAGAVVVAHIPDTVRARIPVELPIVEASANTLEAVIAGLVLDTERRNQIAEAGRKYVEQFHSGRYAAEILLRFIEA